MNLINIYNKLLQVLQLLKLASNTLRFELCLSGEQGVLIVLIQFYIALLKVMLPYFTGILITFRSQHKSVFHPTRTRSL